MTISRRSLQSAPGLLAALLSLTMVGCGSTAPADAGLDAGVDAGASDAGSVDAGSVLHATGVVTESDGGSLEHATVCVQLPTGATCASTDGNGGYTLELHDYDAGDGLDVSMTVTAPEHLGFTGVMHEHGSGFTWYSGVPLMTNAEAQALWSGQAGFAWPSTDAGFILVGVFQSNGGAATGQRLTVTPGAGATVVYASPVDGGSIADPSATAITSVGYAFIGGVTPGPVTLTTSEPCTPMPLSTGMWSSSTPNSIAGVVNAGSMTRLSIHCQ
jgi:hypothetical protein